MKEALLIITCLAIYDLAKFIFYYWLSNYAEKQQRKQPFNPSKKSKFAKRLEDAMNGKYTENEKD